MTRPTEFRETRTRSSSARSCSSISVSPAAARSLARAATFPSATGPITYERGVGMAELDRNTPTLMNLRGQRWYGWDGAADSLWSQSLRPIVDARELAATPRHVADLVRNDEQLSCHYRKTFGAPPSPADDEAVFVNVGKALAAFQETLFSGRTPFDQFRDALARGESPSSWAIPMPAQRGLKIFIGKGGCTVLPFRAQLHQRRVLQHRPVAVRAARQTRSRTPRGNPAAAREPLQPAGPLQRRHDGRQRGAHPPGIAMEKGNYGEFKVPPLRNLMLTAPYGRDGRRGDDRRGRAALPEIDPARLHANDGQPAKPRTSPRASRPTWSSSWNR